jgi:hypothetical protein
MEEKSYDISSSPCSTGGQAVVEESNNTITNIKPPDPLCGIEEHDNGPAAVDGGGGDDAVHLDKEMDEQDEENEAAISVGFVML